MHSRTNMPVLGLDIKSSTIRHAVQYDQSIRKVTSQKRKPSSFEQLEVKVKHAIYLALKTTFEFLRQTTKVHGK